MDDLESLVADISQAGLLAGFRVNAILGRHAKQVQDTARELAPGASGGVAKHYPASITYDVTVGVGSVVAEIGPDREKNGQAKLGNVFEYGTSDLPPRWHLGPALDRQVPKFQLDMGDIGDLW